MPRFAANLSMLYPDVPFKERFAHAARDGFQAVEYLFPYEYDVQDLQAQLRAHGLQQVLFNAPPGNWEAGERGMACVPGRQAEFRASIDQALAYAMALDCRRIHVMAGIVRAVEDGATAHDTYCANLAWAADQAASAGRTLLIEPINTRDMPGYFLNYQHQAETILADIGARNVQVQFDVYHCQIMEGDICTKLAKGMAAGRIGHIQVAGVPGRNEPDTGELHYAEIFRQIEELSNVHAWAGWIGCEYRPREALAPGGTSRGLGWLKHQVHAEAPA